MSPFARRHSSPGLALREKELTRKRLKEEISQAIAWGIPDSESIGMPQQSFATLLSRALREIEVLEAQLKATT